MGTLTAATDSNICSHTEDKARALSQENKERVAMVASVLVSSQCARAVSAKRDAKLALIVLVYLPSCLPRHPSIANNSLDCAEGCC